MMMMLMMMLMMMMMMMMICEVVRSGSKRLRAICGKLFLKLRGAALNGLVLFLAIACHFYQLVQSGLERFRAVSKLNRFWYRLCAMRKRTKRFRAVQRHSSQMSVKCLKWFQAASGMFQSACQRKTSKVDIFRNMRTKQYFLINGTMIDQ